jgi:hypothetical protein
MQVPVVEGAAPCQKGSLSPILHCTVAPAPLPMGLHDHWHSRARTTMCVPRWTALAASPTQGRATGLVEVRAGVGLPLLLDFATVCQLSLAQYLPQNSFRD